MPCIGSATDGRGISSSMSHTLQSQHRHKRPVWSSHLLVYAICLVPAVLCGCRNSIPTIAVIPRTCGTILWEAEHTGVVHAAKSHGWSIYWNAPMREDDNRAQIEIMNNAIKRGVSGVILAPVEALPLRTSVYRAIEHGIPMVIVGTDLGLPPGPHLSYVLNDEQLGGKLAAREIGSLLRGRGDIAILGIHNQLTSTSEREHSLEATLRAEFPNVHVVFRSFSFTTASQEQQSAERLLSSDAHIQAIAALSENSTRGAFYALHEFNLATRIHLVGFDQNLLLPLRTGGIDAVLMQNTNRMGREAIQLIDKEIRGNTPPGTIIVPPLLVTRENINSPEVNEILNLGWYNQ